MPIEEEVAHYKANASWDTARYWYETWRQTTALTDPPVPAPWIELDTKMQLALCAVADGVSQDSCE